MRGCRRLPFSLVALPLIVASARTSFAGDAAAHDKTKLITQRGDVTDIALTEDGGRVVYRADEETDQVFELFSVPVDGSAAPTRLNQTLPALTDVDSFLVGACDRIVYAVDLASQPELDGLFSVAADGSESPVLLRGVDLESFALGANGSDVVFKNETERVFSVPIDGSSPPVELTSGIPTWDHMSYVVSRWGNHVVLRGGAPSSECLYSVAIDGSAAPSTVFCTGWTMFPQTFTTSGTHGYFLHVTLIEEEVIELYVFPLDGSQAPVLLGSSTFGVGARDHGDRIAVWQPHDVFAVDADGTDRVQLDLPGMHASLPRITMDGASVVFPADGTLYRTPIDGSQSPEVIVPTWDGNVQRWQLTNSHVVYEVGNRPSLLRSVPIAGGEDPVLLNPPPFGRVHVGPTTLHPSGLEFLYWSTLPSGLVLTAVPVDGSALPRHLSPPVENDSPELDLLVTPDGARAVYRADQRADERYEVFSVLVDGSAAPVVLNGPLAPGIVGGVTDFPSPALFSADGLRPTRVTLER